MRKLIAITVTVILLGLLGVSLWGFIDQRNENRYLRGVVDWLESTQYDSEYVVVLTVAELPKEKEVGIRLPEGVRFSGSMGFESEGNIYWFHYSPEDPPEQIERVRILEFRVPPGMEFDSSKVVLIAPPDTRVWYQVWSVQ